MDITGYDTRRAKVTCKVVKVSKASKLKPRVYCRAVFALIESVIHATRIEALISEGEREEAEKLIGLIRHYADLVKRVAPESIYLTMINDILRRIDSWKAVSERSL